MEQNYGALYAEAIAQSGTGSEVLPDDTYDVKIGTVKPDTSKNGKFKVGIRLQVIGGPHDGKSTWVNQTFSPENPTAVAIFIRLMRDLGVPQEAITAGLPPQQLIAYIVVGSTGRAVIGSHVNGTNPDGTPKRWQDLKSFTLGAAAAPVVPQAGVPALPAQTPVQGPAVEAPTAVPAPVAAPPLPVQPSAPAPGAVPAPF